MNRDGGAHLAAYADRTGQRKRKPHCPHLVRAILTFQFLALFVPRIAAEPVLFLSTQLTPLNEAGKMRQVVLKEPLTLNIYHNRLSMMKLRLH